MKLGHSPKFKTGQSEIESEHTDGVIRQELVSAECVRRPEQHAVPARPCSEIHRSRDNSSQRLKKSPAIAGACSALKIDYLIFSLASTSALMPPRELALTSTSVLVLAMVARGIGGANLTVGVNNGRRDA